MGRLAALLTMPDVNVCMSVSLSVCLCVCVCVTSPKVALREKRTEKRKRNGSLRRDDVDDEQDGEKEEEVRFVRFSFWDLASLEMIRRKRERQRKDSRKCLQRELGQLKWPPACWRIAKRVREKGGAPSKE